MTGADRGRADGRDHVGSAAEEAARLLGALSGWAGDLGQGLGQGLGHGLEGHLATGAPECTYCPVCRAVHVVRTAGPEVTTHLAHAATSLLQAAAGILATAAAATTAARDEGPEAPSGDRRSRTVQNIDLDDEPGTDGEDEA